MSTPVSEDTKALDLEPLKALCAAASPGPWQADVLGSDGYAINRVIGPDEPLRERFHRGVLRVNWLTWDEDKANAELVAASRSAIPALIAEVERLRAERDSWARRFASVEEELADKNQEALALASRWAKMAALEPIAPQEVDWNRGNHIGISVTLERCADEIQRLFAGPSSVADYEALGTPVEDKQ